MRRSGIVTEPPRSRTEKHLSGEFQNSDVVFFVVFLDCLRISIFALVPLQPNYEEPNSIFVSCVTVKLTIFNTAVRGTVGYELRISNVVVVPQRDLGGILLFGVGIGRQDTKFQF